MRLMRPRTLLPLVVTVLLLLMIYQSPRHQTHAHAFVAVPAPAPDLFDSGSFYRLTTLFQGECKKFVTAPPASLQLNSFYRQYLDADGIPVISSGRVPVEALYRVRFMALQMLSRIPQAKAEMIRHGARIAVMSKDEQTLDIPEHAFLKDDHSVPDWNARARGLGGTVAVPTGSCAEENVMCYAGDRYHDEDIFIHEFSHSIHKLGLVFAFPEFQRDLQRAYSYAIRHARWIMTYAASNSDEYFAEGVQDWFNVNAERNPPDGVHNFVNTRAELKTYDPNLYNLLKRYFPEDDNKCTCH